MSKRLQRAQVYMAIAELWSRMSTCSRRAAVGAVLVSPEGRVVASGYNGSPSGEDHCDEVGCLLDDNGHCTRAIHAEENALIQCAIHGVSSVGTTLYVTHTPCFRCCGKLIQAGISRIVWLKAYPKNNLSTANIERLTQAGIEVEWYGESDELLLAILQADPKSRGPDKSPGDAC